MQQKSSKINFSDNTFKWDETPVTVMPAKNLTYTAKWTENTYKVTFHSNNGFAEEETKNILYTGTLIENSFTRPGYSFVGWSDGVKTYNPTTALSELVNKDTTTLNLDAVWEKVKYAITYEGVDEYGHDNATEYTIEDMVSLGDPNARAGYTFRGWFDNAAFEGTAVETITVGSTGAKIFYALWEENAYTVVLNANDGLGASTTTAPILYTGYLPANTFQRAGYTFKGWTDGVNTYSDLAAIADIIGTANDYNQVTLDAVWAVNTYTITYDLGMHAASDAHGNPTEYSAELGADVVLRDLTPKSGFQFGGWYTNPEFTGAKVTTIACTDTTNYELYAKWEHAGSYSIKETGKLGYKITYTITRTIPDGAVATTATQNVYVRTQNGTAYGTTVEATGQDKYHFIHNYAVLSFGPNDADTKTFVVTEKDISLANDPPASWQIGGKARTYRVEIYKVENNAGGLTGTVGTKSVTRTMPVATKYQLSKDLYTQSNTYYVLVNNEMTDTTVVSNKDVQGWTTSVTGSFTGDFNNYCKSVGGMGYIFQYSFDVTNFKTGADLILGRYLDADEVYSPDQGDHFVRITGNGHYTTTAKTLGTNVVTRLDFRASYNGAKCTISNLKTVVTRVDTAKPAVKSAAPMATTAYKKGDTAYITVIYSEPINSISGTPKLILSSKLSPYFENPTYVNNGTGTNSLVFKVTAKKDITADEIQNTVNTYLAFPVSGVGGSFSTNIGTVSATVKDILGN